MSKQLTFTLLILTLCIQALAAGNATWDKANKFYEQKEYDSAVYYYKQLSKTAPRNAEVYYNLGNTYYRLNDIGHSVLNYEKALKYNPDHKKASDNLYLAKSRISNRIQEVPVIFFIRWWRSITKSNLANTYAIIAAGLFILLIVYYSLKRLDKINIDLPTQLSAGILIVSIVFIILGIVSANRVVADNKAVVMQGDAPFTLQPGSSTSQSLIPEGTTVKVTNEDGSWTEVILPDGRTGWMSRSVLSKI